MPVWVIIVVLLGVAVATLASLAPFWRKKCGTCAFFDKARHLCLMRDITAGTETPGCITHKDKTQC